MSTDALSATNRMSLSGPPPACSSCYGQYPDRLHVDFGAAWDGPVLDGAKYVAIDDLIICDECLAAAARLIGMESQAVTAIQTTELEEQVDLLRGRLMEALAYIKTKDAENASRKTLEEVFRPAPAKRAVK